MERRKYKFTKIQKKKTCQTYCRVACGRHARGERREEDACSSVASDKDGKFRDLHINQIPRKVSWLVGADARGRKPNSFMKIDRIHDFLTTFRHLMTVASVWLTSCSAAILWFIVFC